MADFTIKDMQKITLQKMTRGLCHELYKGWQNDDAIFMDMSMFKPFEYSPEKVDKYFDSKQEPTRILFVIMLEDKPIGEVQLKQIDFDNKECELSIHMQNDDFKGKGYGTEAERQAIQYAFEELELEIIYADTIVKNVRSQHIIDKLGFEFIRQEGDFKYYQLEKKKWLRV
ncbi:GNAT family N-acetyltransferase [Pseudobutyrivibrio xylanivorans]|uniref:Acetyltransferase (GNAT) domain-containing protein n=1 Tax=Pseudobutyrivibrio xylanivorans TaxID=185007 RepID=A0A1G5RSU3_PSEXY|nr:GNAT family N-acetyltransferase [Pseudobutyrivibrio xylanivorans]SCZ76878.1 Acetyltransferase (GNAT) domain-containing protein [Pseudobutyrivibrio xylanivorans]